MCVCVCVCVGGGLGFVCEGVHLCVTAQLCLLLSLFDHKLKTRAVPDFVSVSECPWYTMPKAADILPVPRLPAARYGPASSLHYSSPFPPCPAERSLSFFLSLSLSLTLSLCLSLFLCAVARCPLIYKSSQGSVKSIQLQHRFDAHSPSRGPH